MSPLTHQEKDVVNRFQQLPPDGQRRVMLSMFHTDAEGWRRYQAQGNERFRELAAASGIDWDILDDEQRQEFIDGLLHQEHGASGPT